MRLMTWIVALLFAALTLNGQEKEPSITTRRSRVEPSGPKSTDVKQGNNTARTSTVASEATGKSSATTKSAESGKRRAVQEVNRAETKEVPKRKETGKEVPPPNPVVLPSPTASKQSNDRMK